MTSTNFEFPPLDYSLFFPDLINFHMDKNPSFPMFIYPNGSEVPDRLTEISFLEFGRAAHRAAHALRPDRQGPDGQVVMIIANTDTILYHAVLVGLSIAGCVPFPVSPRNPAAAVVNMLKKANCTHIVTLHHAHKALIDDILRENGGHLTVTESPTLQYVFPRLGAESAGDPFVQYPSAERRPDLDSPALYLHSSGSTGFPKPIAHSYRIQIQWMSLSFNRSYCDLPAPRRTGSMAPPPFHAFGVLTQLYIPIACVVTAVVYSPCSKNDPLAPPVIPTSNNAIEYLEETGYQILFTFPMLLEQMAWSQEAIEKLKKVDAIRFGGGPTPVKVGDALCAAGIRLSQVYGSTEMGVPVAMAEDKDVLEGEWTWMRFPDELKIRWAPQGDGTYELHILSSERLQMAVENLPDIKGYASADLFVKHPTKDSWRIIGRVDDVINLASGENVVPVPMESIIGSSPLVQGVVMFGRERNQVGVLIEPRLGHPVDVKNEKAVAEFRSQIWPVIEDANKLAPTFSRIFKEMILITSGDKPILRSPKGTIQRKATLNTYNAEINAIYDAVEAGSSGLGGLTEPSEWTSKVLEKWFLEHALSVGTSKYVDPHVDLFIQGFDSLSATHLRNRLLGALQKSSDPATKKAIAYISQNVVFEHPTIRLLSSRVASLVNGKCGYQAMDYMDQHKQVINAMIEKYSTGLGGPVDGLLASSQLIKPTVVLVTGTTGGLGSFLLSELLKSPSVQCVYAFNRPSSKKKIEERQKLAFEDRGLPLDLLTSSKLIYAEVDVSLERCGLSLAHYEEIRKSVTLIIHNAWRLDFNLAMSSFDENIRASRNLVDLGLNSPRKNNIRYLFTSSISSAQGWNNSNGPFPEDVQQDPDVAVGMGYGESKYVTERIVVKSGLHATSLRIGQIAGGPGGSWATTDWFPIIVKSSVALGVLPEAAGVVSWLREEDVASTILEIGLSKEAPPPALNIVNPRSVPWSAIISFVRRAIIRRKGLGDEALPIVPFANWFALLESKARDISNDDLVKIPAIKLLEFLRTLARGDVAIRDAGMGATEAVGMTNCSTSKAQRISATMANMQAVGELEADAWVGYWISKGAF